MFSKHFLAIAAVAVAVNAQDSSSIPPCVLACVVPAATINGCSFSDASCVCASAQFIADASVCLNEHCDASDIAAALALQQSHCFAAGVTPTGTATIINSIPFTLASTSVATRGSASSSAPVASTAPPANTTPPASTSPPVSTHTTAAGSTFTGTTTAPASSSKAAASGLIAQSSAGAVIGVVLAGVLAL